MVLPNASSSTVDPGFHPDGFISNQNAVVEFARNLEQQKNNDELLKDIHAMELALCSESEPALTREEAVFVREHVYAVFLAVIGPALETPIQQFLEALHERYQQYFE